MSAKGEEYGLDGYDPVAEGDQDQNGVDLVQLRANLKLSVEERLRNAEQSANSLIWFLNEIEASRPKPTV